MSIVYLALGSNMGDRLYYIHKAIEEIKASGIKVVKISSIVETDPQDAPVQDKFLNAVLKAQTLHSPEDLIFLLQGIERKLGRKNKMFRGPRVIDIDILLYDDIKLVASSLLIPHPRMLERPFVMKPLEEIDPLLCASLKI